MSIEEHIQYILDLEKKFLADFEGKSFRENLFNLCMSFNADLFDDTNYECLPCGKDHANYFLKKGIFYWDRYLEISGSNWLPLYKKGNLYKSLDELKSARMCWWKSYKIKERAEPMCELFLSHFHKGNWDEAYRYGSLLSKINYSKEEYAESDKYYENNWRLRNKFSRACHQLGVEHDILEPVFQGKKIAMSLLETEELNERQIKIIKKNINIFKKFIAENV